MADTLLLEAKREGTPEEEAAIVREAQRSLAGFRQLYLRWLPPVFRYFYFRTGSVKDAEDLTSQVFLTLYEELPRYRERGRFSAWLFTLVRHKAIDFFRKASREVSLETLDPVDGSCDLLAQVVLSDEIQRLNRLIRALPDEEQELIRLRFVANLGYREIGEMLHRKEDTVRKTISRLLARLQGQLERRHE